MILEESIPNVCLLTARMPWKPSGYDSINPVDHLKHELRYGKCRAPLECLLPSVQYGNFVIFKAKLLSVNIKQKVEREGVERLNECELELERGLFFEGRYMCTLLLFSHVNSVSKDSGQVCSANLLLREHSNLSALAPPGNGREHLLKIELWG